MERGDESPRSEPLNSPINAIERICTRNVDMRRKILPGGIPNSECPPANLELKAGAGKVTRTPDLLITNQLLYQLSYSSLSIFLAAKDIFDQLVYYTKHVLSSQVFFRLKAIKSAIL